MIDDEEENESMVIGITTTTMTKYLIKVYGTLFGWLIGVFIQFSSLGANQFFVMNNNHNHNHPLWQVANMGDEPIMTHLEMNDQDIHMNHNDDDDAMWVFPWWSLLWSFVTSAMGVTMLWLLRKPILGSATANNNNDYYYYSATHPSSKRWTNYNNNDDEKSFSSMLDVCFSMGSLAGVCMAWMVTDVAVLGWSSRHLWHSAITLATSMGTCHILVRYWFHPQPITTTTTTATTSTTIMPNTNDDLEQPLLPKQENDGFIVIIPTSHQHHSTNTMTKTSSSSCSSLRPIALVLGGLVGIFIQFSSLGANFLSEQLQLDSDQVLVFSLIWSFWTSVMGIGILVVIRRILTLFLEVHDSLLVQIECCFAIGATLGLNIAWTITDLAMGLETHMTQSLVTLLGTLLWCRLVLYCYERKP
jgi:hypothetical protein